MCFCIHEGHNWGGDFALYIAQAEALLNTSVDKLYALNKFSTDHAFRVQGPYLYPMGFPILLTGPYYAFGLNFPILKFFCGLFFLLAIPLYYQLFRPSFSHSFYPLCILAAFAVHYEFISFCDNVLSDLPFFFFSAATFLQMRRTSNFINQLVLGALLFFTYYIRDIGILFLPTLFVFQLQRLFLFKKKEPNVWYYLLPYLVFAILYTLNTCLFPKGNANHYSLLWQGISGELLLTNSMYYTSLLSSYFLIEQQYLLLLLLVPLLIGVFFSWKQDLHYLIFTLLTFLIYIVWPFQQGFRFIFPVMPLLLYFLVKGLQKLTALLKLRQRFLACLLIVCLSYLGYESIVRIVSFSKTNTNLAYNADTKDMYKYISENINKNELIGFAKPRVLRLFTGHNSILSDLDHFQNSGVSYLLIRTEDIPVGTTVPYKTVYETKKLILVHR